jgi:pilus assembly protein CpaF
MPRRPDARAAEPGASGGASRPPVGQVEQVRDEVRARLAQRLGTSEHADTLIDTARREAVDELITEVLRDGASDALAAGGRPLGASAEASMRRAVHAALSGLGPFEALLADPEIENINANGCDNVWVRYAGGRVAKVDPVASSDDELIAWVRQVIVDTGGQERRFDRGSPTVDAQLPDGSRLKAVMAVGRRVYVSLRRFRYHAVSLEALHRAGTLDAGLRSLLNAAVRARLNVLVAGGTMVGKTTLLRALATAVSDTERLITVEDAFELNLDNHHPDVVALQARPANTEGVGEVSMAELVRWALRMSPDRVIVGEVRGDEVVPMLNAMSQGCDGSMATVHASSSAQALLKLATYAVQSAERLPFESTGLLIASAVHLVVHLDFAADSGMRVVSSVREVLDADGPRVASNEIYRPGPDRRGRPLPGALSETTLQQLCQAGFDPAALANPDGWWAA